MWWPWKRPRRDDQVRGEGEPLRDGDVYPFPGYPRWAELVTKPYPTAPPETDETRLVRRYVIKLGYEDLGGNQFWWRGFEGDGDDA